jgi:hypothetical protein
MSTVEAKAITFDAQKQSRHFRLDFAKQNFSPACVNAWWFRMESCLIDNGEHVGVPVPVNLKPLFSNSVSKVKWSDLSVAEALERIFGNAASRDWKPLLPQFMTDNQVASTSAYGAIELLSEDPNKPTIINNGNEDLGYWRRKSPRGSITINRKAL